MGHPTTKASPDSASPTTPHIPALDGIRGIALLGILLFHAGDLKGGWLGVDLFFVLSGFLITSLLLAETTASNRVSLSGFWARRARRLLPAVFALLLAIAVYLAWWAPVDDVERLRRDAISTLFYIANWNAIWSDHDYWRLFLAPSPLEHTWSLAIEEQFYLVWPILIALSLRFGATTGSHRKRLIWIAGGLSLASALWMALLFNISDGTARPYFGADTRAFEPLIGATLAALLFPKMRQYPKTDRAGFDAAALAATIGLGLLWLSLSGTDSFAYRGGLVIASLTSALLIAGVVLSPTGYAASIFSQRPLRWMGRISYGAYLWHWPLFIFLSPDRLGLEGWPVTMLRLMATFTVAEISFRALEEPIRRKAISNRATLGFATVGGVLVLLALLPCELRTSSSGPAKMVQKTHRPPAKVLLVGDSLALVIEENFANQAAQRQWESMSLGANGCPIVKSDTGIAPDGRRYGRRRCRLARKKWDTAIADFDPDFVLVLVGGAGVAYREGKTLDPCDPDYQRVFYQDLREAISRLGKGGATVALTTTAHHVNFGGVEESRRKIQCLNAIRTRVAEETSAELIDLYQWTCPEQKCVELTGNTPLRSDGVHYRGAGADATSAWLLDQLAIRGTGE